MRNMRRTAVALICMIACGLLAGCGLRATQGNYQPPTVTNSNMSRVMIYDSLAALASDSELIITGVVGGSHVAHDIDDTLPFAIHDIDVKQTLKGSSSSTVVVRQTGGSGPDILKDGQHVLLFLVQSGLDGDLAEQYYPVGVNAGIYLLNGEPGLLGLGDDDLDYIRLVVGTGDDIPVTVSLDDVKEAIR